VVADTPAATVSGRVVDEAGRPLSNDIVVVFPADREKWGGESRVVKATRSQRDGSYRFEGLPAADYLAVALVALPWMSWNYPEVLELIQSSANAVPARRWRTAGAATPAIRDA
jgi:hypothetical protein